MKFSEGRGEHFFRSTLVQTLFYGVFSAWVRWHKENPGPQAKFDWRTAQWSLHLPFISTLYEELAKKHTLGPLGLVEVLDWAAGVLNRVERGEFFRSFEDENAVQYFYEPFLDAYDPELRKDLGVWYTPPEIVKYQVARVDTVLRQELGLADGLADPSVIVLDPCCGTGAYLVEVLRSIERTIREKRDNGLVGYDVKLAATTRVFGFEIMPAPFVIAHLQIGALLQQAGSPLSTAKAETRRGLLDQCPDRLAAGEGREAKSGPVGRLAGGTRPGGEHQAGTKDPGRDWQSSLQRLRRRQPAGRGRAGRALQRGLFSRGAEAARQETAPTASGGPSATG